MLSVSDEWRPRGPIAQASYTPTTAFKFGMPPKAEDAERARSQSPGTIGQQFLRQAHRRLRAIPD